MPGWRQQVLEIFLRWKFRPWALLTPIVVLLVALPLLRPLMLPAGATDGEELLTASIESVSQGRGMAVNSKHWRGKPGVVEFGDRLFAARPPVFAVVLAGPAWVLQKAGLDFEDGRASMAYFLTLLGVTLPVAVGAGVIYRMGRLFELSRPMRALLALLVAFCGGWISYATVLNPHAPAAAMLMCGSACLLYVGAAQRPGRVLPILILGGLLLALSAAISPWALPLVLPMPLVLFCMQIQTRYKLIGFLLLTAGFAPVIWTHCAWSLWTFGSIFPPTSRQVIFDLAGPENIDQGVLERLWILICRLFDLTLGNHGLITHFPLIVAAVIGLVIVLRKHWPMHAKMLAAITLVGSITIVMMAAARQQPSDDRMFGVQWFVVFLPLMFFWLGAILRRDLSRGLRITVAVFASISALVSIAGARQPLPVEPYAGHTALGAIHRWITRSR